MFQKMSGTFSDYALSLRFEYSEEIFQKRHKAEGGIVAAGWEVVGVTVDQNSSDGYKATTTAENARTGDRYVIKR